MATTTFTTTLAPLHERRPLTLAPLRPQPSAPPPPAVHAPAPAPAPAPLSVAVAKDATAVLGRITKRRGKPAKKVRSSKSNVPGESRYWTPSEHKLFVEALLKFGPKSLRDISTYVGTRNMIQCRTHSQKCFQRLMREAHKETLRRAGIADAKAPKDTYSVPPSCGIALLCVVSDELRSALQG